METKKDALAPEWVSNLRSLMAESGLNPRSLSLRAGLNATAVRDMLEGRSRFPRYDTVQSLADALGVTPATLMGESGAGAHRESDALPNVELLTEIIARLQETVTELGRELPPREFAAMSATIYRRVQEVGEAETISDKIKQITPQIHDFLNYETLRVKGEKK
jgi:transcriptional regulator with XRE-family HTH domain